MIVKDIFSERYKIVEFKQNSQNFYSNIFITKFGRSITKINCVNYVQSIQNKLKLIYSLN